MRFSTHALPTRLLLARLTASLAFAATALPVAAADLGDPFGALDKVQSVPCAGRTASAGLRLADVVDLALCNNPQTREAWASARVQAAQVGVAQSAYLPSLTGSLGEARTRTRIENRDPVSATVTTASATLSYLLWDFGAREANLESARQLLAAAIATQDSTAQTVFLSALQAFYQVHAYQAAVEAAEQSEKAARESLSAADARYRSGVATPADRLQAQTALSQATLTRIGAEGNLRTARGTLANAIGLDAHRPLALAPLGALPPPREFERGIETLIDEARQRRPDLAAAEAQARAARASVDAVRAGHLPTLSLGATPSRVDTAGLTTNSSSIGVTLSIPLFSGFNQTYKVRSAEATADLRAATRDRLQLQVALDVWRAYQSLATATQSLRTTADLLASAEESERVARGRYSAGVGSILDLLTAQTALASARQQRVQSAYDWNVSRATLAQAVGALDADILPVLSGDRPLPPLPVAPSPPSPAANETR